VEVKEVIRGMCFGSEIERTFQGECRTTEDVARLFERYRARAREDAEETVRDEPAEHEPQAVPVAEPVLAGR